VILFYQTLTARPVGVASDGGNLLRWAESEHAIKLLPTRAWRQQSSKDN